VPIARHAARTLPSSAAMAKGPLAEAVQQVILRHGDAPVGDAPRCRYIPGQDTLLLTVAHIRELLVAARTGEAPVALTPRQGILGVAQRVSKLSPVCRTFCT
jgi:hypothetical protein